MGEVARREVQVFVDRVSNDEHGLETHSLELFGQQLRLRRFEREVLDHRDAAFAGQLREDGAQTCAVHLLVDLVREVFFRRVREDATTAAPQRARRHTGTSAARTLLTPRLLGGVLDVRAILLGAVTAARVRLVRNDDLVNQASL